MAFKPYRLVCPIKLMVVVALSAPLSAGMPTIAKLVGEVPALTPATEQLQKFTFTLESPLPFEVPVVATLSWSRPDKFEMTVMAGEERTPFWFLAHNKALMFDVTTGTVVLTEDAGPTFVVESGDDKLNVSYSLAAQGAANVRVDLPSLLRDAVKHGELSRDPAGNWRVTTVSESGKTKVIAVFKDAERFPILHLEVRSAKDDSLAFAIRDIAINGEAKIAFREFPAREAFPKDLQLMVPGDRKLQEASDGIEGVARGIRTLAAHGALRNAKWRNLPYLVNVDWDRAEELNRKFGPPLRQLLAPNFADP